ncbi:hypothetical protein ACQ4PT_043646 [Festuca glaucescens]
MMMMSDDDDDLEPQLKAVWDYFFVDEEKHPVCFSVLPIRFAEDPDEAPECEGSVFLRGTADPGIPVYKQVVAWKLGLQGRQPEIAVLSKEGSWINLAKPRNSYEVNFRTIFITVQMLHFLRRKPEEPEKSLWNHLRKVFDKFDVRPSKDDFRNHRSLMKQFAEKDSKLAKSEMFRAFIEERSKKQLSKVDSDNFEMKESFIAADEDVEDMVADVSTESEEDEEDDLFDFTCAICDNGGDLLGCDGPCMRSFHAKIGTGEDSQCDTLGFTEAEVEAMKTFLCKNCEYKQHQCFICGVLEPSDGPTAKVFLCNNATCGYFYHPKCVARRLHPNNKVEALEKENSIAGGFSFTCPIHWCFQCKGLEDRSQEHLQFAVCRRCPKSYHRKCLPRSCQELLCLLNFLDTCIWSLIFFLYLNYFREIPFEDSDDDEDIVTRAWDLSKRILIYCLDHEIDSDLETPVRNHIKFPGIAKIVRASDFLKKKTNVLTKKNKRTFGETFPDQPSNKPAKLPVKVRVQEDEHARRSNVKSSSEKFVEKPEKKQAKLFKQRTQPEAESTEPNLARDSSVSSPRPAKEQEKYLTTSPLSTGNMPQSSFPRVNSEIEKRVIALVEKEVSSLTLLDISRKCFMPSTHVYSGKQTDKIVATGRLDQSVKAVGEALKTLETGGSVNNAKAACEPQVLTQLARWHTRLRVYLSPFIHGSRYSSLGRHFTKVEKLVEIVDRLHWYVEPGDTIVDFCCGANDFCRLMKEKLDHVEKNCHFKNYDLIQPQNSFCFEKRDWMTVQPNELPRGSQLIMGLNPPFGVKAALANKFIDKALSFKPKLIVLIVPKETKRLDQKKTPYDLVWEDGYCLAGKSFYYPGSVGLDDHSVEGWNISAPPLYLWSRPDWTNKHKKVAEEHNHTNMGKVASRTEEDNLSDGIFVKKETKSSDVPVRRQAKPEKSKQNGRSGKAKEKTAHDVREVSPTGKTKESRERTSSYVRDGTRPDEPLVKKQDRSVEERAKANCNAEKLARFGEEEAKEANCLMKKQTRCEEDREANASDNHPVKKQAEASSQQMCRPGKQNSRDGSKSSDDRSRKRTPDEVDSLPPEKQVEVAYEETRVVPSKRNIHKDQRDVLCDDGINAHVQESKGGGSDMSMSFPQTSNAQYRSRSDSPFVTTKQPSDYRTAHLDGNTSYHEKEPHIPTYQGSYLMPSDWHNDAPEEKNDPMLYTSADDISRKYSSSIEDLAKQCTAASAGGVYSLQAQGDGSNLYGRQDDYTAAPAGDVYTLQAQGDGSNLYRRQDDYTAAPAGDVYSLQAQGDGSNLYRRQDDYLLNSRYSLGSSGARYDQPTSQSYGLSGTTASQSSVIDRYGLGLLGASGSGASAVDKYAPVYLGPGAPGSSVMDRYAPTLADTNYATRGVPDVPGYGRDMSGDPPHYPYRGPGSSGRGPPYILACSIDLPFDVTLREFCSNRVAEFVMGMLMAGIGQPILCHPSDIRTSCCQSVQGALEGVAMLMASQEVQRDITVPDAFTWTASATGQYYAKSTYFSSARNLDCGQKNKTSVARPDVQTSSCFVCLQ